MRYRSFLLEPGTLFTLASGLLLILAVFSDPSSLFSHAEGRKGAGIIYLAAALVGSSYIWWSALQGIRDRDFTADIPVSVATIATIKHNLVFSLGVLAIAVALTVPGILTPVTGAMLHELSSIPVIANSMRMIAYGPKI